MLFDFSLRVGLVVVLTVGAYWLTRALVARFALPLLRRTRPPWAAPVERSRLPKLTALLVAVIVLGLAVGLLTEGYPQLAELVRLLDTAVGIGILALMLATLTSIGLAIYEQQPLSKEVPLKGFVQLVQGGIFLIGSLMIVTTFLGVPALYSFAALAAIFTALGFVFQDPIMGFVAGIQLAANKMVAIGDWIEVPQFGANGTVQEILMSTVKVQNWDNTVTTVPTRALISDSFKNWRTMYCQRRAPAAAVRAAGYPRRAPADARTAGEISHCWQAFGNGSPPASWRQMISWSAMPPNTRPTWASTGSISPTTCAAIHASTRR